MIHFAWDVDTEMKEASESSCQQMDYELPDCYIIAVRSECLRCPEIVCWCWLMADLPNRAIVHSISYFAVVVAASSSTHPDK